MKTVGGIRRTRYQGLDRAGLAGYLVATAYNLVCMTKLLVSAARTPVGQASVPSKGLPCTAVPEEWAQVPAKV
jgi:hypothetical protein